MEQLNSLANGLLELIYPRRAICVGCGAMAGQDREWLCEVCRRNLADRWIGAGQPPEGGLFDGAAYAYRYGGPVAGMVRSLKYRGVRLLAEPMGRHMAHAYEAIRPTPVDCVVPVPMYVRRLRERGFNHAALLADQVARRLELPVMNVLERTRDTRQQARLGEAERLTNLDGAFSLREQVSERHVLLVDDVCTTGATANACARVLLGGGVASVWLLCFATAIGERK